MGLMWAPGAFAQDEPDPPVDVDLLDEEREKDAKLEEPAPDADWSAFQEWLSELTPEERVLLQRLEEWEDVLDPDFVERLEFELSGYTGEPWERNHPQLHVGFEAGTVTGVRMQLQMKDCCYPILGVRMGVHTWTRSDVALQPLGLGYLAVPMGEVQIVGGYGLTNRDGAWGPAGNAALTWAPWDPLIQMAAGLIWGPGFRSIDVSYAWMW